MVVFIWQCFLFHVRPSIYIMYFDLLLELNENKVFHGYLCVRHTVYRWVKDTWFHVCFHLPSATNQKVNLGTDSYIKTFVFCNALGFIWTFGSALPPQCINIVFGISKWIMSLLLLLQVIDPVINVRESAMTNVVQWWHSIIKASLIRG